jgi:hypothetical protein
MQAIRLLARLFKLELHKRFISQFSVKIAEEHIVLDFVILNKAMSGVSPR